MNIESTNNQSNPHNNEDTPTMFTDLLHNMEADLDETAMQIIHDELEWERLNNIFALSQTGDGWDDSAGRENVLAGVDQLLNQPVDRRAAIKLIATGLMAGFGLFQAACAPLASGRRETAKLNWQEYFKGNFRLMTDEEKEATVTRLERLHEMKTGQTVNISKAGPQPNVLYGYAFNINKCRGYMDCVRACLQENNQDRASDMRYIRIHEHKQGGINFETATDEFYHEVPADDHFYLGTQCFHCENPPCVPVCPVQATWKEEDGIVVVDYDWCIGCRYCIAACPYDARRFNWSTPTIPSEDVNLNQHYLGNRLRPQGVTEKCTFCIQRTRQGKNPACVEACPTGARIFGNLLDPNSEIRWILKHKKVFRLKEDLGTEPKFWYFMD
ncbi:MAG TPA: 4Fe-4S dicluster domain-containing protein [Anaerolineae bacterium]|nr:4Fe-4S dicluster domain-containing protein [Anaerolineae bacterium]